VVIETDEGLGSGFIIKPDGIIVTNNHVVANAKAMAVKFPSGEVYRNVYLLSSDPINDLAALQHNEWVTGAVKAGIEAASPRLVG
jgi:S1-C subfamily serine protease